MVEEPLPQCLGCGKLKEWEEMGEINHVKIQVCKNCLNQMGDKKNDKRSAGISKKDIYKHMEDV